MPWRRRDGLDKLINAVAPAKPPFDRLRIGRLLDEAIRLQRLGRRGEAVRCYQEIVRHDGGNLTALLNLSAILIDQRQPDEAIRLARKALNQNPRLAGAHVNIGNALQLLRRYDEAIDRYKRALAIEPQLAEAHSNMGYALAEIGLFDEAIAHYEKALRLAPSQDAAHINLGQALEALNRHGEAIKHYEIAQELNSASALAAWDESLARLATGDFDSGWTKYEMRWRARPHDIVKREFAEPRWSGAEDLTKKTIFTYAEQGLGDTLQFARYVPLLAQLGARVVLEVQPTLKDLLAQTPGLSEIRTPGEPLPSFDYHCPLLSLPGAFGTRIETIPADIPYCFAPPERAAKWRRDLGPKTGTRVGFMSAGNAANWRARRRNLPLQALLELTALQDIEFVCLEQDLDNDTARALAEQGHARLLGPALEDFADTAGLIANLDLVVSVDTSVAHLAGAMGKPLWLLLPFSAEWRWLKDREDSPWYPTARLFRQSALGDWPPVIARVTEALRGRRGRGYQQID